YAPPIASGIARLSLFVVALPGFALVVYLSFHGFDRAVLLIPTWLLLVLWVITAALAVTAVITNDIVGPALLGGLVLIVMLIGFTVMQHAFAGGVTTGIVSDVERCARRTATISGSRSRRGRSWARTGKSCVSWARSPTSPSSRMRKSASCTTRCTTT